MPDVYLFPDFAGMTRLIHIKEGMGLTTTISTIKCSAVILAGGLNSRMGGNNKAFLKIGDKTILERLTETLQLFFKDIVIVTRQPELYAGYPGRIVTDIYEQRSSLTGIHAGLKHAVENYALIVPCDIPFLKPEVIQMLLHEISPNYDIIVPAYQSHYEPLCAIYAKQCLPYIENQLEQNDFKIINIFDHLKVKTIHWEQLKQADTDLLSFFNVNTPEAYQKIQQSAS